MYQIQLLTCRYINLDVNYLSTPYHSVYQGHESDRLSLGPVELFIGICFTLNPRKLYYCYLLWDFSLSHNPSQNVTLLVATGFRSDTSSTIRVVHFYCCSIVELVYVEQERVEVLSLVAVSSDFELWRISEQPQNTYLMRFVTPIWYLEKVQECSLRDRQTIEVHSLTKSTGYGTQSQVYGFILVCQSHFTLMSSHEFSSLMFQFNICFSTTPYTIQSGSRFSLVNSEPLYILPYELCNTPIQGNFRVPEASVCLDFF